MFVISHRTGFNAGGQGPVYVGGTTGSYLGNASAAVDLTALTGGIGTAPIVNDIVIVCHVIGSTSDDAVQTLWDGANTGWTTAKELYANDTNDTNILVVWKVMTATPDTSVTPGGSNANNAHAIVVHVWRGVNTGTSMDTAATEATGTNTVLADPAAITPVSGGAVIIVCAGGGHAAGQQTFTHGALGNLVTVGGPNATNDATAAIASIPWPGGAYNPAAFGFSAADNVAYSYAAATLALRPA
jgi:hypothetical protein